MGGRISLGKANCSTPAWKYNSESELITQSTDLTAAPGTYSESISWPVPGQQVPAGHFWKLPPGPSTATVHIFINAEILLHTSAEIPANSHFTDHVLPASAEGDAYHIALAGIRAAFFSIVAAWGGSSSL